MAEEREMVVKTNWEFAWAHVERNKWRYGFSVAGGLVALESWPIGLVIGAGVLLHLVYKKGFGETGEVRVTGRARLLQSGELEDHSPVGQAWMRWQSVKRRNREEIREFSEAISLVQGDTEILLKQAQDATKTYTSGTQTHESEKRAGTLNKKPSDLIASTDALAKQFYQLKRDYFALKPPEVRVATVSEIDAHIEELDDAFVKMKQAGEAYVESAHQRNEIFREKVELVEAKIGLGAGHV